MTLVDRQPDVAATEAPGPGPMRAPISLQTALRRASLLHKQGRLREAETAYHAVLLKMPDQFDALHNLGVVRLQLGHATEAVTLIEQALVRNPTSADALHNLGSALQALNRQEESVPLYERALFIRPNFADAHNNLGAALKALGRLDEALAAFERAVVLAPGNAAFFRNLVDTKTITAADPLVHVVAHFAQTLPAHARSARIQLHFALGKVYADLDQQDRAFDHFVEGNALKRQDTVYDEKNTLGQLDRIRKVFDASLVKAEGPGCLSNRPVFVVGMPRSGTSLVEQILASHPAVFGAGERNEIGAGAARLRVALGTVIPFPEVAAVLPQAAFTRLGAHYEARLRDLGPHAIRTVDKMPSNFRFLGLIHRALPNARIIHVRRDPVSTCLSCFSILFTGQQGFAYDLAEIGRYYRAYERLMGHWRSVLPPGVMIEVGYEDIVADLEMQARRMISHCGLDWHSACLAFHKTSRPVKTASALQVRQPLYRTSLRRWRPDEVRLRPLLEGLGLPLAPQMEADDVATRA